MLEEMVLRGDEGTGEEARFVVGCGYNDTIDSAAPGEGPSYIRSSPGESSRSVYDLE